MVITKQVKEKMKVDLPCYLYNRQTGRYSKITEKGNLVKVGYHFLAIYNEQSSRLQEEINEALATGEPCTEKDFEHAIKVQIKEIQNQE